MTKNPMKYASARQAILFVLALMILQACGNNDAASKPAETAVSTDG